VYVINLVAWETELKDKIRHRKTEYDRAVRRKMRNSNIRKSEEELELSRFYFARLYARMGWGSPPFPPKEYCGVSLEPIEPPAAAEPAAFSPRRPRRSHRREHALSPMH
jgi:hypothetical protein